MNIIKDKQLIENLIDIYRKKKITFPLISAVLNGVQDGNIFNDGNSHNYFVVHKFGFADLIEIEPNLTFDNNLEDFLFKQRFYQDKIRWYNLPDKWNLKFTQKNCRDFALVDRIKFSSSNIKRIASKNSSDHYSIRNISLEIYDLLEEVFALSLGERFWRSKDQFLAQSFGKVLYVDNFPVSICYACAVIDGCAEVDVFTHPEQRGKGFGKYVVGEFINACIDRNLQVGWDCYENNRPSCLLAQYFSFKKVGSYVHAIISR